MSLFSVLTTKFIGKWQITDERLTWSYTRQNLQCFSNIITSFAQSTCHTRSWWLRNSLEAGSTSPSSVNPLPLSEDVNFSDSGSGGMWRNATSGSSLPATYSCTQQWLKMDNIYIHMCVSRIHGSREIIIGHDLLIKVPQISGKKVITTMTDTVIRNLQSSDIDKHNETLQLTAGGSGGRV